MKKRITAIALTLALTAAMTLPVSAETTYTEIKPDSASQSANTELGFEVAPTYTVTIPEDVTLTDNALYDYYSQQDRITASDVKLNQGATLNVTLDSEYELDLNGSEYKLPYTVKATQGSTVRTVTEENDLVASFSTSTEDQTVTIDFQTEGAPQYAGKYSDTVTFNIAVVEPSTGTGNEGETEQKLIF